MLPETVTDLRRVQADPLEADRDLLRGAVSRSIRRAIDPVVIDCTREGVVLVLPVERLVKDGRP